MKLPKINKKILDAPFVQCYWKDINSSATWTSLKEAKASKVTICITSGWLLKADNDTHVIAGNVTTMPTVNVLKIKKVTL